MLPAETSAALRPCVTPRASMYRLPGPGVTIRASEAVRNRIRSAPKNTPAPSLTLPWSRVGSLLHRHALGEVARLVHVEAARLGDAVSEQLQRHGRRQRTRQLRSLGHRQHDAGYPLGGLVAFVGHGYHPGAARDGLLDVGEGFFAQEALAEYGDDGAAFVHEGYWAVLHLAGGVSLGGEVGDLLELQCPFESERERGPAPQEQRAARLLEEAGGLVHVSSGEPYGLLDLLGREAQGAPDPAQFLDRPGAFRFREREREQVQRRDLRDERLGGGNPDLGTGFRQQHRVGLARDERTLRVGHREDAPAETARRPDCRQGVGRLAALAYGDDEDTLVPDGIGVTVLAGDRHLHVYPRELLDGLLGQEPRVVGRAAGDNDHARYAGEIQPQLAQVHRAVLVEPSVQGGAQRDGLFVDFLEHEVLVAAEFDGLRTPINLEGLPLDAEPV